MAGKRLQNVPIRPWVPGWLGIWIAFIIMLPIIFINGTYTGSITEISGTLGVLSEDISMAYYATSVGMAVAYPIVPRIKAVITTKTVLLADLLLQVLLSFICARAGQMEIIIACSFLIGFLKAFAMLEIIIMIRPFFSPRNIRSEFYAYFYPIVFSAGQISMVLTAELAYRYQWQYMYYFVILLLLISILLILVFFRYGQQKITIPLKEIDGQSILLIAVTLLMVIYAATYGKTQDWFSSRKILLYTLAAPLLLWLFIFRQSTRKNPYIRLEILNQSKALIGYFFMMLVMFLSASSSLLTPYLTSVLRTDSVHANSIYLWMLPGFILGAFICFWWFRWQRWRFRYLIGTGMSCFVLYLALIYFGVSPSGTYRMLFLPMVLRGMGMMMLFIAFGVYVVEDLAPQLFIYNAFFLIACRSAIAPALGSSFFNNLLYRMQLSNMDRLSDNMTLLNPLAAQQYSETFQKSLAQGNGAVEAGQLAVNGLYTTLQTQSLLLSIKAIAGYVLIFAIAVTIASCLIPFHKTLKVAIVRTGEDMV